MELIASPSARTGLRRRATACALALLIAVLALGLFAGVARASSHRALDAYIRAKMAKAHYPGLECCIVKDGRIVFAAAYGWADIEDRVPMTTDSILEIASISKTVVATATLQCVERGVLTLDEDIGAALGYDARNPKYPGLPVTVRMLMTHTSSITDRWPVLEDAYTWGCDSPVLLDDFVYGYLTPGGAYWTAQNWGNYRPDARYSYSNAGAATCGDVVERASGVPFDAWCDQNVFAPLGMTSTSWRLRDLPGDRLAMPYEWHGRYVPQGQYGYADYPDGMVHTTVKDLGKYLIAYLQGGVYRGHRILEPATVDAMLKPWVPDLDPTQGLIWYSQRLDGRTLWGHNGGNYGISSEMWMDRATGEGVIFLANGGVTSMAEWAASDAILARLFEKAETL